MGSSSSEAGSDNALAVVERDPSNRYVRYNMGLGHGAYKIVYMGFDEVEGKVISWTKTELTEALLKNKEHLESLCAEARLLESLEHENIVSCYHSWVDHEQKIINMITEFFNSGNLSRYIATHDNVVDYKAIKIWARQILQGLEYLHSRSPPIVHRDMKCENIFVDGKTGRVKIGEFGLALILERGSGKQTSGTPQFMAPELLRGEYDHLADIYSFGMCVLQMIARDRPYRECKDKEKIIDKIHMGVKPAVLRIVNDLAARLFILKCLNPASSRPSATVLLNDPFLAPSVSDTLTAGSSLNQRESVADQVARLQRRKYRLKGSMKDNVIISMNLRITDFGGHEDEINFEFSLDTDTTQSVVERVMATEVGLLTGEVTLVSELIDQLKEKLKPSECSDDARLSSVEISMSWRSKRWYVFLISSTA